MDYNLTEQNTDCRNMDECWLQFLDNHKGKRIKYISYFEKNYYYVDCLSKICTNTLFTGGKIKLQNFMEELTRKDWQPKPVWFHYQKKNNVKTWMPLITLLNNENEQG